ncbi:hypothetical protein RP20_CCG008463 [Aedes albopictus]|nr:hypothetical protein RP20_CCG022715 [Aedes albopictus]KXJ77031.1 hypothetical protein RP20_CCG008463 [Aedes albopictus]
MSLLPVHRNNDRMLFYHPMSSYTEFQVPISFLQNEIIWQNIDLAFQPRGSRGKAGKPPSSGVARNNVHLIATERNWLLKFGQTGCGREKHGKLTFPNGSWIVRRSNRFG